MSPSAVGILLARSDSSRLPGKVLMDLGGGHTLIGLVAARARQARELDDLVLATSDRPCDDALADYAAGPLGLPVFRGAVDDVAGRALAAAESRGATWFARINGDSPFVDAALLDAGIRLARETGADLVSNVIQRSHPYGVAVEVFRVDTYRRALPDFDAFEREHIARHLYQHPDRYRLASLPPSPDPALAGLRLTVDDADDLAAVRATVSRLGDDAATAGYLRVADLIREVRG
ncbi:MAG: NTP transferase domain-containing protein [Verrucomicrobiales bacterium]|nr:NTP transferase domain-containing protein [Verrucomicrobiales bacterium]